MLLDETINSIDAVVRVSHDKAADMVSVKPGKFGGLTRALQIRNLCTSLGIQMSVEDQWGWCITNAMVTHLSQSTPPQYLNATVDFTGLVEGDLMAHNTPTQKNGRISAPTGPGLGIEPKMEFLGEPVAIIE
jgi:L-alanine-DL-glutamate epimerase-like enolase superfamily enzyme